MLLAQLAMLNLDDTIQSSEYVGRVCLVVRVLQQALALIWSRTQCYLHTRRLRNGIGVHRFVHGIGEVTLQVTDNVSLKMHLKHLIKFRLHLIILVGKRWRFICIAAVHGISQHYLHIVCETCMGERLRYAVFSVTRGKFSFRFIFLLFCCPTYLSK